MEGSNNKKRGRDDSDESTQLDSPEVKRIRDDFLLALDDYDPDSTNPDLVSVMRSFEEEISAAASPVPVVDLTSDSGESQPALGYLLEASDDELGLPPTSIDNSQEESKNPGEGESVRVDSVGLGGLWGFEDQIPSYDSFEVPGVVENNNYGAEYVAFDDRLFDYANDCFDSYEYSDFSWQLGTYAAGRVGGQDR